MAETDSLQEADIVHDAESGKFKVDREGKEAYLRYVESGEKLDFRSTFVPPEWRNEGLGEKIVVAGLEYARSRDKKVIPSCPFVETVVERRPEFRDLLA